MVNLIAAGLLAASLPGSYDCTIERQVAIQEQGASNQDVAFPESEPQMRRFRLRVSNGPAPEITIDWPGNPIQIAGSHRTLSIAPAQVVAMSPSTGPCMFTEQACVAMVEISAREDGSAAFSILPAGSVRDETSGVRSLMHVVFLGTCRRIGSEAR
jgi:hypothetical protein